MADRQTTQAFIHTHTTTLVERTTHLVDVIVDEMVVHEGVDVVEEVDDLHGRAGGRDRAEVGDVAEDDGGALVLLRRHLAPLTQSARVCNRHRK